MAAGNQYLCMEGFLSSSNSDVSEKDSAISSITSNFVEHIQSNDDGTCCVKEFLCIHEDFRVIKITCPVADHHDLDQEKRKIHYNLQFIDFLSKFSSKSYDEKDSKEVLSYDDDEDQYLEISTEFNLQVAPADSMNKKRKIMKTQEEPMIKKRKMENGFGQIGDNLDLRLGLAEDDIRPIIVRAEAVVVPEDYWKIKKVLTRSDVDGSSRLLLAKSSVNDHILPHLNMVNVEAFIEDRAEFEVMVWDVDTQTEHVLVMRLWSSGSFVLKKNWKKDFVNRRNLGENDEIGIRWDERNSRLEFSLLRIGN